MSGLEGDDRDLMYKDRLYVLIGSDGWVDVRGLSVHLQKTDSGVTVEVWPIETEGLSGDRPLGKLVVKEPEQVRGPAPRKRVINTVRHARADE